MLLADGVDEVVDLRDGEAPVLRSELKVGLRVAVGPALDLLHDVADEGQGELGAVALSSGEEFVLGLHASNYSYSLRASTLSVVFFWIDVSACE